jgi:UDP-glucose 4-epimerase
MRCLVTGGAGFIGSNLVDALVERGDRVTVIDNLSTGRRENLAGALERGATLHTVDLRDPPALHAVFQAARPEVVFHLAAQVDVRVSVERPGEDALVNLIGTINVLEAARSSGARRVVNSSTGGALYGETEVLPTPEDHPIRPLAPYGQAKYAAEGYCALYTRLHRLSSISLRYANVYGPRQDSHGEAGVVAIFCGCLIAGRRPTVFGDGRQTRDWVEVSDVVRANLLAAAADLTGPLNIGTGRETSVLELIAALNDLRGDRPPAEPDFRPQRPGEVRRSLLDGSRARRELGWEPAVVLGDGLRRALSATAPRPPAAPRG